MSCGATDSAAPAGVNKQVLILPLDGMGRNAREELLKSDFEFVIVVQCERRISATPHPFGQRRRVSRRAKSNDRISTVPRGLSARCKVAVSKRRVSRDANPGNA